MMINNISMKTAKILIFASLMIMLASCRETYNLRGSIKRSDSVLCLVLEDYCGVPDITLEPGTIKFKFKDIYPGNYRIIVCQDSIDNNAKMIMCLPFQMRHHNKTVKIK